jgi:hypothetical protein
MIANVLKIGSVVLLVAAMGAASFFLHWQNARLRTRIADLRRERAPTAPLQTENARLQSVITRAQGNETEAARAVQEELVRTRARVAELEQRAEQQRTQLSAQAAGEAEALANNRDPRQGLTRLEHFQNVGQATPGAALQTMIWAAMKGDEMTLTKMLVLSAEARASADQWIAGMPEETRGKWTPEKLAALAITGVITDVSAAEIAGEKLDDPQHATVTLRIPGVDPAKTKLQFQRGGEGWQAVLPATQIEVLRRRMNATAAVAPKN